MEMNGLNSSELIRNFIQDRTIIDRGELLIFDENLGVQRHPFFKDLVLSDLKFDCFEENEEDGVLYLTGCESGVNLDLYKEISVPVYGEKPIKIKIPQGEDVDTATRDKALKEFLVTQKEIFETLEMLNTRCLNSLNWARYRDEKFRECDLLEQKNLEKLQEAWAKCDGSVRSESVNQEKVLPDAENLDKYLQVFDFSSLSFVAEKKTSTHSSIAEPAKQITFGIGKEAGLTTGETAENSKQTAYQSAKAEYEKIQEQIEAEYEKAISDDNPDNDESALSLYEQKTRQNLETYLKKIQ